MRTLPMKHTMWAAQGKAALGLLAWVALLSGVALLPQSAPQAQTSPAPQYCYLSNPQQCFPSQGEAEAALRAQPLENVPGHLWRRADTLPLTGGDTALYFYGVDDQPATLYGPSYYRVQADSQAGVIECTPSSDPYRTRCASEGEVIASIMRNYREAMPNCSYTEPVLIEERPPEYKTVYSSDAGVGGRIWYGSNYYRTTRSCNLTTIDFEFVVGKEGSFLCPSNFLRLDDTLGGDGDRDLVLPILCRPNQSRTIQGPFLQVGSCPANGEPCYPATGDKARFEPDFEFAGRTFVRAYHALNQLSTGPGLAQGWSHTFAERLRPHSTAPGVFTESGYYESFVAIGTDLFRGLNSEGRVLRRFSSGSVRWRLHEPDGERREYDVDGRLIAIRHPDEPLSDVVLTYRNALDDQGALKQVGYLHAVTDAQGRQLRFEYDANRRLSRIVKPDGSGVNYGYDAIGNLVSVGHGNGLVKQYHYAEPGLIGHASQRHHLTGITAETGERYASFRYDARGRAIESRVHGTPNEVTAVDYTSETEAKVTTANGLQRTYTMQPGLYRRVTGITESGGGVSQLYDATGRVVQSTDKRNVVTQYEYAAGYLSATVEAVGTPQERREEIDRDAATQRVLEMRTKNAAGSLVARISYAYNTRGQLAAVTAYDPATSATRTATTTYCEQADVTAGNCPFVGLVKAIDGPRGDVVDTTTFAYRQSDHDDCATAPTACTWRKGDLWKTTNALGHTIEVTAYDGAGRVKEFKDEHGILTQLEYDSRGRLTRRVERGANDAIELDDAITQVTYTRDGLVDKVVWPDRSMRKFLYDAGQRVSLVSDTDQDYDRDGVFDGNFILFTLNGAGERVIEQTFDASGTLASGLAREFDTLGRLASITGAYGETTRFGYDAGDHLTSVTDALGRVDRHTIDPLGRLAASVDNADAAPGAADRAQSGFVYDAMDRLIRVTDPKGLHTDYAYNGFGERTRLSSPDTGVTTYGYDAAGNPVTTTDARGVTTNLSYDALDRPTAIAYPSDGAQNVGFTYDTASGDCAAGETYLTGRLARMTDASGSTTWCYDRYGQLTQKQQRTDGRVYALRYLWTPPPVPSSQDFRIVPRPGSGRFYGWRYPDGAEVRLSEDREGRVFQLDVVMADGRRQRLLTQAHYRPFGPVSGWEYGNGLVHLRTFNANYQPGVIQTGTRVNGDLVPNPTSLSLGYAFDAAGNLTALRDGTQADPPLRTYGYDGLDRLTEVRDGSNSQLLQNYVYDATGNRTGSTSGGTATSYAYPAASHRLTSVGTQTRSYDAAGNTLRIGGAAQAVMPPETQTASSLWHSVPDDGQPALRARADDAHQGNVRTGGKRNAQIAPASISRQADARATAQAPTPAQDDTSWQAPETARAGMAARLQDLRAQREREQAESRSDRPFWQLRTRNADGSARSSLTADSTTRGIATQPLSSRAPGEGPAFATAAPGTAQSFPAHVIRDFTYNAANRMSEVRHNGTVAMQYRYNGLGEQVLKFSATRRIATVYDEEGRWIGDYDATTGQPLQQVIWLHDLPVGLLVGSGAAQKLYYIEPDALGTPRVVLDPATSRAVWRWDLTGESFGDSAPNQDPDGDGQAFVFDMRFPGQRYDAATGMNYNYFRDFDPSTGRYVESDPLGLDAGMTTYGYGALSPFAYTDEYGLIAGRILLGFAARARLGTSAIKRLPRGKVARTAALGAAGKLAVRTKLRRDAAANAIGKASGPCATRSSAGYTVGELRKAGLKDAHHIIQDAAVRNIPGYATNAAPGVQLIGPASVRGTPHYIATQIQRQAGGGSYAAERRIAYKALRRSGFGVQDARAAIGRADAYFRGIGVGPNTATRIPGNRR